MVRAVDLDGDGGDDLVILDAAADDPIRVRFAAEGGSSAPSSGSPSRSRARSPSARSTASPAPRS